MIDETRFGLTQRGAAYALACSHLRNARMARAVDGDRQGSAFFLDRAAAARRILAGLLLGALLAGCGGGPGAPSPIPVTHAIPAPTPFAERPL